MYIFRNHAPFLKCDTRTFQIRVLFWHGVHVLESGKKGRTLTRESRTQNAERDPNHHLANFCGSLKCPGNRGDRKNQEEGNHITDQNHAFMLFELEEKARTFIRRGTNVNCTCVSHEGVGILAAL